MNPSQRTVIHPTDALLREDLPGAEPCELEYRPASELQRRMSQLEVIRALVRPCLIANACAWLIYWVILPSLSPTFRSLGFPVMLAGLLLWLGFKTAIYPATKDQNRLASAWFGLCIPASVAVLAVVQSYLDYRIAIAGVAALTCIGIPMVLWLGTRMQRHSVYWLSSSESPAQRTAWRMNVDSDNCEQSFGESKGANRFICICGLGSLPSVLCWFHWSETNVWSWPMLVLPVVLLGIFRMLLERPESVDGTSELVASWFKYGRHRELAPSMFQSPEGDHAHRMTITWCTAATFSVLLGSAISNDWLLEFEEFSQKKTSQAACLVAWFDFCVAGLTAPVLLSQVLWLSATFVPNHFLATKEENDG